MNSDLEKLESFKKALYGTITYNNIIPKKYEYIKDNSKIDRYRYHLNLFYNFYLTKVLSKSIYGIRMTSIVEKYIKKESINIVKNRLEKKSTANIILPIYDDFIKKIIKIHNNFN